MGNVTCNVTCNKIKCNVIWHGLPLIKTEDSIKYKSKTYLICTCKVKDNKILLIERQNIWNSLYIYVYYYWNVYKASLNNANNKNIQNLLLPNMLK